MDEAIDDWLTLGGGAVEIRRAMRQDHEPHIIADLATLRLTIREWWPVWRQWQIDNIEEAERMHR